MLTLQKYLNYKNKSIQNESLKQENYLSLIITKVKNNNKTKSSKYIQTIKI
ncbi:hypothetical protein HYE35_01595 [Mycoplasmopsis bovis]|nr:hypothetical protein [Mycoplasmopsis bovis]QQH21644.1 hypothetical protein HYE35_01595 [Mycoplasmopsis bovis]